MNIKKLSKNAIIPKRASDGAAGYDLCACLEQPVIVNRSETVLVPTGIAISINDKSIAGMVYPRSGLSITHGITLANCVGVIDSDYRGEILVGLINQGKSDFTVSPGDRIAQLVFTKIETPELVETDNLDETQRNDGGFGSTGVN